MLNSIPIGKKIRDGPLFFPHGGYCDFQETGAVFFPLSTERLQIFSSTYCADNFLKISQISHNRVGLCRQFFSDAPLWQTIYFSNCSHESFRSIGVLVKNILFLFPCLEISKVLRFKEHGHTCRMTVICTFSEMYSKIWYC